MKTTHAAAISFFHMILLCQDDEPIFVYIIVNAFYQFIILHLSVLVLILHPFPWSPIHVVARNINNEYDYFWQYPKIRNASLFVILHRGVHHYGGFYSLCAKRTHTFQLLFL